MAKTRTMGLFVTVLIGVLLLGPMGVGAAVMSSATIFTDGSDYVHYSGVSAISGGRIVTSVGHDSMGRVLRVFDVTSSAAGMVGGSLIVPTGIEFNDVAYIGNNGTEEMFYVCRDYSTDVFEYWWNPVSYAGTYKGVVDKYNSGSNFPGMDMEFGGTADELVMCTTKYVYRADGSTNPATRSNLGYYLAGSSEFTGVTGIGDVDGDGAKDYVTCRNSEDVGDPEAKGRLNVWLSTDSTHLQSGFVRDDRTYTGVANLGDPDDDGLVELIVTGFRRDNGRGTMEYIQTDITYVPEPVTIGLLGVGGLVTLLRKRRV